MLKISPHRLLLFCSFLLPRRRKNGICVNAEYAYANNISVKQADLQTRFSEVNYQQSKSDKYPTLNFQNSNSFRFGRSENPTTGVLTENNF
jgi:outer membrane protein